MTSNTRYPSVTGGPIPPWFLGLEDDWNDSTYFWFRGRQLWCSFIWAKKPGNGAFHRILEYALSNGMSLEVPTPMGDMERILRRYGFKHRIERDPNYCDGEPVDVWTSRGVYVV